MASDSSRPMQQQQQSDGSSSPSSSDTLSLEFAMKAADKIRKTFIHNDDVIEKNQRFPPGAIQGGFAFLTVGLLMTPLRRSILRSSFVRPKNNRVPSSSYSASPPTTQLILLREEDHFKVLLI